MKSLMKRYPYVEEVVAVGQVEGCVRICLLFEIGAPSCVQRFRAALPVMWGKVVVGMHHEADLVEVLLGQRTFARLVERQPGQAHAPAIGKIPETISDQDSRGRYLRSRAARDPTILL